MTQKAKKTKTTADRLNSLNSHKSTLYSLNRFNQSPVTSATAFFANNGGSAGGSTAASGNYVRTDGDTMIGPLAFHPKLVSIANGEISVSDTSGNYSSRVIVAPASPTTDNLLTISGAAYSGQLLILQGVVTDTITIIDSTSNQTDWAASTAYSLDDIVDNNGIVYVCKSAHTSSIAGAVGNEPGVGDTWTDKWFQANIETLDGADFSLVDDDNIILIFDSTDNKWQQVTSGKQGVTGGSGGAGAPGTADHLFAMYTSSPTVTDPLPMPTNTVSNSGSSITINNPTSNRVTLAAGKTYKLWAKIGPNTSSDSYIYQWYDDTAAAVVGVRGISRGTASSPISGYDQAIAVVTPSATTDYRLDLISGSGAIAQDYSMVMVEELASGGPGTHISASLSADQTTNLAVNDHVEFDTKDKDGAIVLQTGAGQLDGIFELESNKTYKLSAQLRPEFSGASGVLVVAWYDITNGAEIGKRAVYNAQTNTTTHNADQPLAEIIHKPTTDITVELRIISVTALTALANEYCIATIFEINGGGSGGGLIYPIRPDNDTIATVTGTVTIDLNQASESHVFPIGPITGDIDITFTNPPASGKTQSFLFEVSQDGTGGHAMTFNDTINDVSPTVDDGASTKTLFVGATLDGGTTYWVRRTGNAPISTSDFATKALDNLVSPVLNTNINFNSFAPTNFNGYTSQIVGNTFVNDAVGATWTLPLSDIYDYKIDGISEFTISSLGVAVKNSVQLSDTAANPATNGEMQRNGADVKVFSGGAVRDLSDVGMTSFDDNSFSIFDNADASKIAIFQASGITTATTRTYTFPDKNGTLAMLSDVGAGVSTLDDLTDVTITTPSTLQVLRYNGATWVNADEDLDDLNNVIITAPATNSYLKYNGTNWIDSLIVDGDLPSTVVHTDTVQTITSQKTFNAAGTSLVVTNRLNMNGDAQIGSSSTDSIFMNGEVDTDIILAASKKIKANTSTEIGFQVTNDSITLGDDGTLQIPHVSGSSSTAAQADTDFGNATGCMGIYMNDTSNVHTLVVRQPSGNWAGVLLTDNTLV